MGGGGFHGKELVKFRPILIFYTLCRILPLYILLYIGSGKANLIGEYMVRLGEGGTKQVGYEELVS